MPSKSRNGVPNDASTGYLSIGLSPLTYGPESNLLTHPVQRGFAERGG
jgi:hypothetical protein